MKIYGFDLEAKFGSDLGTELARGTYDMPCLIVAHAEPHELRELWEKHREEITNGKITVLAISEAILTPPGGCDTPFFHCLGYGVQTLSQGQTPNPSTLRRFENFVRKVKDLAGWGGIDVNREIWSIVELEPWPEHLVALYLLARAICLLDNSGRTAEATRICEIINSPENTFWAIIERRAKEEFGTHTDSPLGYSQLTRDNADQVAEEIRGCLEKIGD